MITERRRDASALRILALVSAVIGFAAGAVLLAFFTLANPYDATPGGPEWWGTVNHVLGVIQFATFAPVAWTLRTRLPATRTASIASTVGTLAMIAMAVLGALLVSGVLTFEQQIGPVIVTITLIFGWLLVISLMAHRIRGLPRRLTAIGIVLGAAYPVALLLVISSLVTPGVVGQLLLWVGLVGGGLCWLALPVIPLLASPLYAVPDRIPAAPQYHKTAERTSR